MRSNVRERPRTDRAVFPASPPATCTVVRTSDDIVSQLVDALRCRADTSVRGARAGRVTNVTQPLRVALRESPDPSQIGLVSRWENHADECGNTPLVGRASPIGSLARPLQWSFF